MRLLIAALPGQDLEDEPLRLKGDNFAALADKAGQRYGERTHIGACFYDGVAAAQQLTV